MRGFVGFQRRRLIPAPLPDTSSLGKKVSSAGQWVDLPPMSGPLKEPFEIKVYEIDDVERLQRRRQEETTEVSRRSPPNLFCVVLHLAKLVLDNVMPGSRACQSNLLSLRNILHVQNIDATHAQDVPNCLMLWECLSSLLPSFFLKNRAQIICLRRLTFSQLSSKSRS